MLWNPTFFKKRISYKRFMYINDVLHQVTLLLQNQGATNAYLNGGSIVDVQHLCAWKDMEMMVHYLRGGKVLCSVKVLKQKNS